ncbi:hypothetical protein [Paracoccus sp. (in: a-proteobacteria)]|uniref:hypothetical protein n=1 Tax=Paracoccus sp. TaxID=267 RepID=UPI00396CEDDF
MICLTRIEGESMNMNMLFNMFTRMVARRAMNWGINKGMDTLSRRDKPGTADPHMTAGQPKRRGQNPQTRDLARKMRVLGRLTRR